MDEIIRITVFDYKALCKFKSFVHFSWFPPIPGYSLTIWQNVNIFFLFPGAKLAKQPIPESERELVNFMRAKYAMESKLVEGYLNKLQETMRNTPPGYIKEAIKNREREIRERLRVD